MATSGSVNGNNVSNGNDYYVTWSLSSQSVANNTSTISWNAYWRFNNSDAQLDNGNVVINGSSRWDNGGRVYNYSGNISTRNHKVASGSYTMSHNSDGTKSFSISGSLTQYVGETSSVSGSFSLPTIPRASDPTWSKSSYTIGETMTLNMNRKSSSFTHNGTIQVPDGNTIKSFSGAGASYSWTPNSSEIEALYARMPNTNSTSLGADINTYSGGSNVGSGWDNATIKTNPAVSSPIFADFTYKDSNSATVAITGNDQYFIQGYSTLQATIVAANAALARLSATMTKYNFAISNISSDQSYVTTDIVKELGVLNVNTNTPLVVKAIDSRTNATPVTKTITVLPYQVPLNTVTAKRLNDFETQTTIHIESVVSQLLVAGVAKNAVNSGSGVKYRYKKTTDVTWGSWNNVGSSLSGGNLTVTDFNVNLDRNYAWNIQVTVTDKLNTTTTDVQLSKGIPIFFIGDNGKVSINKLPENGDLDVDGAIYADAGARVETVVSQNLSPTNGYIRYSSGRQIAWKSVTATAGGTAWDNGTWYSDHSMGNWLVPFSAISVSIPSVSAPQYYAGQGSVSNTSAGSVRAFRPNAVTLSCTMRIYAEGTWTP